MNASLTNATTGALATQPMNDIRDIKPILPLPGVEWLPVALTVLACIILALLTWLAWKWWKKRKDNTAQIPVLPPHEQAFKDLDILQAMPEIGDKPYYFRISQILRAYVGGRFHMNALEMTTEELLPALKKTPLDKDALRDIKKFCTSSDLVKYATSEVGKDQRDADHAMVRALITRTAQQPEAEDKTPEESFSFATSPSDSMPKEIKR